MREDPISSNNDLLRLIILPFISLLCLCRDFRRHHKKE